ncbi:MAG: single-stranded-DNA-specific exonuclease RecJ [Candidatus Izimaplasma sp.]|nr:single-stranded-DNA-specific exonuclease RecJ [Candidatus Izimaplasma bacterium]
MSKWKVKNPHLDIDELVKTIYSSRGITDYKALFNLNEADFYDPYAVNDMQKAVDRIMKAVQNKDKILIYGDYDVDGITSTCIMFQTIETLGGHVEYDIPNRFVNGYGLTRSKTYDIINSEFNLVITVDNGIKSHDEIAILMANHVDVIVTDHHEVEEDIPKATACLHTSLSDYPFKPLAGVGVAFKLSMALLGEDALDYSDLAALGTIADMMPLIDENRAIVNVGLNRLIHSSNIGLRTLIKFLKIESPSVADVQFQIAPRLNACGRMKSAKIAVELLQSKTQKEALQLIKRIEEINNNRKALTKRLYDLATQTIDLDHPSLIVHSPQMHEGVVGIVASRLANEYNKVAVVLKEEDFTYKGSIRSYNGVDVHYILSEISQILLRYGGHQSAAGLEFKKEHLTTFIQLFNSYIPKAIKDTVTLAEGTLNIEEVTLNTIFELEEYDLKDALFVFDHLYAHQIYLIKGEHTKLIIDSDTEAIFFNNSALYHAIKDHRHVALLGRLDYNTFRGRTKKQILIEDYKLI